MASIESEALRQYADALRHEHDGNYKEAEDSFSRSIAEFRRVRGQKVVSVSDYLDEAKALSAWGKMLHDRAKKATHAEGEGGSTELFVQAAKKHIEAAKVLEDARIRRSTDAGGTPDTLWNIHNWIRMAEEHAKAAYDYEQASKREPEKDVVERYQEDAQAGVEADAYKNYYLLCVMALNGTRINGFDGSEWQRKASEDPRTKDY